MPMLKIAEIRRRDPTGLGKILQRPAPIRPELADDRTRMLIQRMPLQVAPPNQPQRDRHLAHAFGFHKDENRQHRQSHILPKTSAPPQSFFAVQPLKKGKFVTGAGICFNVRECQRPTSSTTCPPSRVSATGQTALSARGRSSKRFSNGDCQL